MVLDEVSAVEPEAQDIRAQLRDAPEAFGRLDRSVVEERGRMNDTRPVVRTEDQQIEDDERA
jgi:hypothetical protein